MIGIFKKIFKTLVMSFLICFFAMILLMIVNKIMGVNTKPIVYVLLGLLCFVMLSAGLMLSRYDYIFKRTRSKKVTSKPVERTAQKTKTHPKNIQRKSRKREVS